jgi:hypothetical protein
MLIYIEIRSILTFFIIIIIQYNELYYNKIIYFEIYNRDFSLYLIKKLFLFF